ncbi:MAG: class I SAM-dependent rRNA methyltransferase [Clostridia bacterium]|nr:class I SAM-dependent rRNA methyltransferase [Clostridia bacterium]
MRCEHRITINQKAEKLLKSGHVWVYGEEITFRDADIENGEIVDIFSEKNRYIGSGFYNDASKITVRLLSVNANDRFDDAFFIRRLRYAVKLRQTIMQGDLSSVRLIFGDSDLLPGLIVDKFENVLVAQVMTLGIEKRKQMLFDSLLSIMEELGEDIRVLYERSDVAVRLKEGLDLYTGSYYCKDDCFTFDPVVIKENGVQYYVDYVNGQKTGFFLDQKYNRSAAAAIAKDKTVLDCFTHTGAFALNCAKNGAKRVTAVDISESAIANTKRNAQLNGCQNVDFLCEDVFHLLDRLRASHDSPYDYIILDPPAFTKSNKTVRSAYLGYKQINLSAMRLLPRGGYLATCSCSHFMTDELFRQMLKEAADEANVRLRLLEYRQQAKDHPVLLGVPETEYLKFYILQVE